MSEQKKSGLEKSIDKRAESALVKVGNAVESYRSIWRAQKGARGETWSDEMFAEHVGKVTAAMARKMSAM